MIKTLKEIVDEILSAMESDAVNSINDTQEAQQVALLVQSVFYDIATELDLDEQEGVFELEASTDDTKPVLMTVPVNCIRLDAVRYNTQEDTEVRAQHIGMQFIPHHEFIERTNGLYNDTNTNVGSYTLTIDGDTFEYHYYKDRMPSCYTTIKDKYVLFDAYDSEVETTLQSNKTMAFGRTYQTFLLEDTYTPPLSPTQFAYLRNKAKARAFIEMKQTLNTEATNEVRIQKIAAKRRGRRTPDLTQQHQTLNRFGRK